AARAAPGRARRRRTAGVASGEGMRLNILVRTLLGALDVGIRSRGKAKLLALIGAMLGRCASGQQERAGNQRDSPAAVHLPTLLRLHRARLAGALRSSAATSFFASARSARNLGSAGRRASSAEAASRPASMSEG